MKSAFETFLDTLAAAAQKDGSKNVSSITALAANIGVATSDFLTSLGHFREEGKSTIATENFRADVLPTVNVSAFTDLVTAANVPEASRGEAVKAIATILNKAAGGKSSYVLHNAVESNDKAIGLESLFAPEMLGAFKPGMEAFGINTDTLTIDVKTAIVVSLMKWHTTLLPRLLANRSVTGTEVAITRETSEVYTLDDTNSTATTTLLDLYSKPDLVNAQLQRVVARQANDVAPFVLVADGVMKLGKDANILALSVDANKFGHSKINRTDLLSDGMKLETILVVIDDGVAAPQTVAITVPESRSRLTRNTNGDSTERYLNTTFTATLDKTTKDTAGALVTALNFVSADDAVSVVLRVSASADLRSGIVSAMAQATFEGANMKGLAVTAAASTKATNITAATVGGVVGAPLASVASAYTLDARFSEENLRKTNIAVTTRRKQLTYQIPVGRTFVMDWALGDARVEGSENAAVLSNVIRIGLDARGVDMIESTLNKVGSENSQWIASGRKINEQPGRNYAMGGKVAPTAISATLNFTTLLAIRDADRTGDILARTVVALNAVISKLHTESKFTQQLTNGAKPVYRLVTSPKVLANILGQPHVHDHLNAKSAVNSSNGAELTLVLPGGAILEVITSTFDQLKDKMIIVPFGNTDAQPELNFGINFDCGTFVSQYNVQGNNAANQRLFASARELPIPTNVIGAIIDVVGIDNATYAI